jgi:hypothetical protein
MAAAAYRPVFLPHSPRHSCFIKLSAVPAYPIVHSWFRRRLSNSDLFTARDSFTRSHTVKQRAPLHSHNCPLRLLVDSPGQNPTSIPCGCEIQTCTRVITQTACLQSPEGPPQLFFPNINPIPSPARRKIASLPAPKQSSGQHIIGLVSARVSVSSPHLRLSHLPLSSYHSYVN